MDDADRRFGDLVVSQGLCSREQVQECLATLDAMEAGSRPPLAEMLVKKGYLGASAMPALPAGDLPPDVAKAALHTGARVGRYIRVSLLGAGGMGEVWKAWDIDLRRWVALKFVKGSDEQEAVRFKREAQTAAMLNHPNIGAIYEVGESGGQPFIAMQLVDGMTLTVHPRNDVRKTVSLLRDAALAVHAANEKGVIHRDLKPDNLMVDRTGRLFVMDFGLAKQTAVQSSLSMSGMAIGTPSYMSPEQARGQVRAVDARTDVYGLGATLYAVLTDRPPFDGGNALDVMMKVVEEDPKPVRGRNPSVDRDLDTITMKCLEKDPARRYGSAAELAADLQRWLDGEAIHAHPPSLVYRAVKGLRRRRAAAAVTAILVLAAGAFAAVKVAERAEAREWVALAETRVRLHDFEEAKRLLDQARTRITVDPDLYRRCEAELEKRREGAEAKRLDDEVFGPVRQRIAGLPASADGRRRALQLLDDALERVPESWQAWMAKGKLLETLGADDEAIRAFRRAAALNPRLGAARYRCGVLLRKMHRYDDALAEFEAAQTADPGDEFAIAGRAYMAVIRGEFRSALDLCDQADRAGQHVVDIHVIRGFVRGDPRLREWFDPAAAEAACSKVIELTPESPLGWLNRGRARREAGRDDDARKDYLRAMELGPFMPEPHANLGNIERDAGRPDKAIAHYDRALALDPKFAPALGGRAVARSQQNDRAGARSDVDGAIRLQPDTALFHHLRAVIIGDAASAIPEYEEALASEERALQLDPRFARARVGRSSLRRRLAGAYRHAGRDADSARAYRGAVEDAELAVAQEPGLESWYELASCRLSLDRPAEAVDAFTEALRFRPSDADALAGRAIALITLERLDEALRDAMRAVESRPDLPAALSARGIARQWLGDLAAAKDDLTRALDLDPDLMDARISLAIVRRDQGDPGGSVDDLTRILVRNPAAFAAKFARGVSYSRFGAQLAAAGKPADAAKARKAAIADLDDCVRAKPSRTTHHNRALARFLDGDFRGALDDLNIALTHGRRTDTLVLRAEVLLGLDRPLEGIQDLTEAIAMDSRREDAWRRRAECHELLASAAIDAGRLEDAIRHGRIGVEDRLKAHELLPPSAAQVAHLAGVRQRLGACLDAAGRQKEGDAEFQAGDELYTKAIELNPSFAGAYADRGEGRERLGRRAEAVRDMAKALELAPADWPHRDYVQGRLRELSGKQ